MKLKILIISLFILILPACGELANIMSSVDNNTNDQDNTTTVPPVNPDTPNTPDVDNPINPDNPPDIDNPEEPDPDNPDPICQSPNPAFPGTEYSNPSACLDDRDDFGHLSVIPSPNPGPVENPVTDLEKLANKYPYGNYGVADFKVMYREEVNGLNRPVEPQDKENAKRITIEEKKNILQMLAIARFVINTPEFAAEFIKSEYNYCGTRNFEFPWTTHQWPMFWGKWIDKNRYLYVIKNHKYYPIEFTKKSMDKGTGAEAVLGRVKIYTDYDEKRIKHYTDTPVMPLYLPNRLVWTEYDPAQSVAAGNYKDEAILAPKIFHETLHHFGIDHNYNTPPSPYECDTQDSDAVYKAQEVMRNLLNNKAFNDKYAAEKVEFKDFYVKLYGDMLQEDTLWEQPSKSSSSFNLFRSGDILINENIVSCPIIE